MNYKTFKLAVDQILEINPNISADTAAEIMAMIYRKYDEKRRGYNGPRWMFDEDFLDWLKKGLEITD